MLLVIVLHHMELSTGLGVKFQNDLMMGICQRVVTMTTIIVCNDFDKTPLPLLDEDAWPPS